MNDFLYILRLFQLGHFFHPENKDGHNVRLRDLLRLRLNDRIVQDAIYSFQQMGKLVVPNFVGGVIDDNTKKLFEIPRCDCPDYALEKVGSGSWPQPCQKNGVTYSINKSGMPSKFLTTWDEQIMKPVVEDYANIGLKLIPATTGQANIRISFRSFIGSTIGLASFNNESCSDSVSCELSTSFSPNEATEADLLKHEMGHNCNLQHTSGGTMNPYIINRETFYKWNSGDPSWNTLVRYFGGEPIGPVIPPLPKTKFNVIPNIALDEVTIDFTNKELTTKIGNQIDKYVLLSNKII